MAAADRLPDFHTTSSLVLRRYEVFGEGLVDEVFEPDAVRLASPPARVSTTPERADIRAAADVLGLVAPDS